MNFPRQAVILSGGKGTRLKQVSKNVPKPLIKLDGVPFLKYQINYLSQFPFQEIILLCGYKQKKFENFADNIKQKKIPIKVIYEDKILGTGGAIINAKKYLDDIFFLCNGDTFFQINLIDFFHKFTKEKSDGIIALKKSNNNNRYSEVKVNKNIITLFSDLPVKKNKLYNCGYYFFKKKLFFEKKIKKSLENEMLPIICKKYKISYKTFSDKLLDIGIPKDLKYAEIYFKKFNKRKYILLDRDGVINKENNYVHKWKDFKLIPGIIKLLKNLNKKKIPIFIVSNQAGVGKGYYGISDVENLHNKFINFLTSKKIFINQIYYCCHHKKATINKFKKNCSFRKPNNSFFKLIRKSWNLKSNNAILIEDNLNNKLFASKSNIKFILFDLKKNKDIYKFFVNSCKKFLL